MTDMTPVWLVGITMIMFVLVILWGRRYRERKNSDVRELRACDIFPQVSDLTHPEDFLYGIIQDFSSMCNGWIIRDTKDQEITRVTREMMQNGASWTLDGQQYSYEGAVPHSFRDHFAFRRNKTLYCGSLSRNDRKRLGRGWETIFDRTTYFDIPNIGLISVKNPLSLYKERSITLNGKSIGAIHRIGPVNRRGSYMLLDHSIALPLRIFIFSMTAN